MLNRLQRKIAKLALQQLDGIVYQHIKKHPGQRCFEIDKATLNSHHQWGTKHILQRLERQGKVYCVKRQVDGIMKIQANLMRLCGRRYHLLTSHILTGVLVKLTENDSQ